MNQLVSHRLGSNKPRELYPLMSFGGSGRETLFDNDFLIKYIGIKYHSPSLFLPSNPAHESLLALSQIHSLYLTIVTYTYLYMYIPK